MNIKPHVVAHHECRRASEKYWTVPPRNFANADHEEKGGTTSAGGIVDQEEGPRNLSGTVLE